MPLFQLTLYKLLTPGGTNPAWWRCPIQQGIPTLLSLAKNGLLIAAGFVFLFGILITVYNYLTAYGDEGKIKKARDILKWTFIGAIVIMLSGILITTVAGSILSEKDAKNVNTLVDPNGTKTTNINDKGFALQGTDSQGNTVQLGNNPDECSSTPSTVASPSPDPFPSFNIETIF